MSRVFTNGPGDQGSIPGRVIPKTQNMVLDIALFNTQHYKVRIKVKVEQSREWSVVVVFGLPSTKVANFIMLLRIKSDTLPPLSLSLSLIHERIQRETHTHICINPIPPPQARCEISSVFSKVKLI